MHSMGSECKPSPLLLPEFDCLDDLELPSASHFNLSDFAADTSWLPADLDIQALNTAFEPSPTPMAGVPMNASKPVLSPYESSSSAGTQQDPAAGYQRQMSPLQDGSSAQGLNMNADTVAGGQLQQQQQQQGYSSNTGAHDRARAGYSASQQGSFPDSQHQHGQHQQDQQQHAPPAGQQPLGQIVGRRSPVLQPLADGQTGVHQMPPTSSNMHACSQPMVRNTSPSQFQQYPPNSHHSYNPTHSPPQDAPPRPQVPPLLQPLPAQRAAPMPAARLQQAQHPAGMGIGSSGPMDWSPDMPMAQHNVMDGQRGQWPDSRKRFLDSYEVGQYNASQGGQAGEQGSQNTWHTAKMPKMAGAQHSSDSYNPTGITPSHSSALPVGTTRSQSLDPSQQMQAFNPRASMLPSLHSLPDPFTSPLPDPNQQRMHPSRRTPAHMPRTGSHHNTPFMTSGQANDLSPQLPQSQGMMNHDAGGNPSWTSSVTSDGQQHYAGSAGGWDTHTQQQQGGHLQRMAPGMPGQYSMAPGGMEMAEVGSTGAVQRVSNRSHLAQQMHPAGMRMEADAGQAAMPSSIRSRMHPTQPQQHPQQSNQLSQPCRTSARASMDPNNSYNPAAMSKGVRSAGLTRTYSGPLTGPPHLVRRPGNGSPVLDGPQGPAKATPGPHAPEPRMLHHQVAKQHGVLHRSNSLPMALSVQNQAGMGPGNQAGMGPGNQMGARGSDRQSLLSRNSTPLGSRPEGKPLMEGPTTTSSRAHPVHASRPLANMDARVHAALAGIIDEQTDLGGGKPGSSRLSARWSGSAGSHGSAVTTGQAVGANRISPQSLGPTGPKEWAASEPVSTGNGSSAGSVGQGDGSPPVGASNLSAPSVAGSRRVSEASELSNHQLYHTSPTASVPDHTTCIPTDAEGKPPSSSTTTATHCADHHNPNAANNSPPTPADPNAANAQPVSSTVSHPPNHPSNTPTSQATAASATKAARAPTTQISPGFPTSASDPFASCPPPSALQPGKSARLAALIAFCSAIRQRLQDRRNVPSPESLQQMVLPELQQQAKKLAEMVAQDKKALLTSCEELETQCAEMREVRAYMPRLLAVLAERHNSIQRLERRQQRTQDALHQALTRLAKTDNALTQKEQQLAQLQEQYRAPDQARSKPEGDGNAKKLSWGQEAQMAVARVTDLQAQLASRDEQLEQARTTIQQQSSQLRYLDSQLQQARQEWQHQSSLVQQLQERLHGQEQGAPVTSQPVQTSSQPQMQHSVTLSQPDQARFHAQVKREEDNNRAEPRSHDSLPGRLTLSGQLAESNAVSDRGAQQPVQPQPQYASAGHPAHGAAQQGAEFRPQYPTTTLAEEMKYPANGGQLQAQPPTSTVTPGAPPASSGHQTPLSANQTSSVKLTVNAGAPLLSAQRCGSPTLQPTSRSVPGSQNNSRPTTPFASSDGTQSEPPKACLLAQQDFIARTLGLADPRQLAARSPSVSPALSPAGSAPPSNRTPQEGAQPTSSSSPTLLSEPTLKPQQLTSSQTQFVELPKSIPVKFDTRYREHAEGTRAHYSRDSRSHATAMSSQPEEERAHTIQPQPPAFSFNANQAQAGVTTTPQQTIQESPKMLAGTGLSWHPQQATHCAASPPRDVPTHGTMVPCTPPAATTYSSQEDSTAVKMEVDGDMRPADDVAAAHGLHQSCADVAPEEDCMNGLLPAGQGLVEADALGESQLSAEHCLELQHSAPGMMQVLMDDGAEDGTALAANNSADDALTKEAILAQYPNGCAVLKPATASVEDDAWQHAAQSGQTCVAAPELKPEQVAAERSPTGEQYSGQQRAFAAGDVPLEQCNHDEPSKAPTLGVSEIPTDQGKSPILRIPVDNANYRTDTGGDQSSERLNDCSMVCVAKCADGREGSEVTEAFVHAVASYDPTAMCMQ